MTTLEKIGEMLLVLGPGEKAQLLQWLARDLGHASPGIESSPTVLNGEPYIIRTQVPVWTLVQARQLGNSEADILTAYPLLRAEDLVNAWAYYLAHKDEIEAQIAANAVDYRVNI